MEIRNYVGGRWYTPSSGELPVINPYTEAQITSVPIGERSDVDAAVDAAGAALEQWSGLAFGQRQQHLGKLADAIEARRSEFVEAIVSDVGTPRKIADLVQVGVPIAILRSLRELAAADCEPEVELGNSLVVSEPIGVVGAITPWNYPLHQVISKVMPALLAGNTVVLKPSEVTPLAVQLLGEAIEAAGFPAGTLNIVHGTGEVIGDAIVRHEGIDMVSFTGSTSVGRLVTAAAASNLKRVTTELGGKGALVLLPDVDLGRSVKSAVGGCFLNSGQTCLALTRLLVHRSQYDEAVETAGKVASTFVCGDPFAEGTKLGPMVTDEHRARVWSFIESGLAEGATLITGGLGQPSESSTGFFVRPTVFADVAPAATIAQEEIFGPVLVIHSYEDVDEAVDIANSTKYGLSAGVRSADPDAAMALAKRLKAGQVEVNGGAYNPSAPFGGVRQSGNGRELGPYGVREFYEYKSIQR